MELRRLLIPPIRVTLRHPWVPGARFRLDARRHLTYWRRGLSAYEPHVARALMASIRPDWLVVEVGTHIGFFTLLLAARARRVVAFEPDARNRRDLADNLARNGVGNVEVVAAACSDREGHADFVSDPSTGSAGGLRSAHHGEHAGPEVRVPVTRLDAFLASGGRGIPDLVKIDAEGAEDLVLEGMGALLDGPTRILVEVNETTTKPVHERLRRHGYGLYNPNVEMAAQPPGTYAGWHVLATREDM